MFSVEQHKFLVLDFENSKNVQRLVSNERNNISGCKKRMLIAHWVLSGDARWINTPSHPAVITLDGWSR